MRYTDYVFQVPEEKIVRLITNTDAKNEADDGFAVVQALLSPKIENVGLVAAHYGTDRDRDSTLLDEGFEAPFVSGRRMIPTKRSLKAHM
nr:hypothetical protein [uncultured Blautia sp.]